MSACEKTNQWERAADALSQPLVSERGFVFLRLAVPFSGGFKLPYQESLDVSAYSLGPDGYLAWIVCQESCINIWVWVKNGYPTWNPGKWRS